MSALAKKSREAMQAKARRLAGETVGKVDSSNWTPAKPLNTEKKTGLQPLGERMGRKSGGRVEGEKAVVNAYVNRDVKEANAKAEGKPHDGGYKRGGKVAKAGGGSTGKGGTITMLNGRRRMYQGQNGTSGPAMPSDTTNEASDREYRASGGKVAKLAEKMKGAAKSAKKEDRPARASGGKVKGKTNISVNILAGGKPEGAMPAMMPAPGLNPMPAPMPAPAPAAPAPALPIPNSPMPMGRKAGGRVYRSYKDMDAGACSGDGRLEKTEIAKKGKGAPKD